MQADLELKWQISGTSLKINFPELISVGILAFDGLQYALIRKQRWKSRNLWMPEFVSKESVATFQKELELTWINKSLTQNLLSSISSLFIAFFPLTLFSCSAVGKKKEIWGKNKLHHLYSKNIRNFTEYIPSTPISFLIEAHTWIRMSSPFMLPLIFGF